jgi:hypothetical protein
MSVLGEAKYFIFFYVTPVQEFSSQMYDCHEDLLATLMILLACALVILNISRLCVVGSL